MPMCFCSNFGKPRFWYAMILVGQKLIANQSGTYSNIGIPIFWLALKLKWAGALVGDRLLELALSPQT